MSTVGYRSEDECSVIGEKAEIGFLDFEEERSVCSYVADDGAPVIVSVPFAFKNGKPQSVSVGDTAVELITINNTTEEPVDLWSVHIFASNPPDSFTLSLTEPPPANSNAESFIESFRVEDRMLQPGEILKIWLSCKTKDMGMYSSVVYFDVGDEKIERVVFLLVEDKISKSLASNRPYSRTRKKDKFVVDNFVPGSRPLAKSNRKYVNRQLNAETNKTHTQKYKNKISKKHNKGNQECGSHTNLSSVISTTIIFVIFPSLAHSLEGDIPLSKPMISVHKIIINNKTTHTTET